MSGEKITREEMIEMFGEYMPIEAVNLVWNSDGSKTCGQIRDELRALAKKRQQMSDESAPVVELWTQASM